MIYEDQDKLNEALETPSLHFPKSFRTHSEEDSIFLLPKVATKLIEDFKTS